MLATVHKILAYRKQIIGNTVLPIGYFGYEEPETRNKTYKNDRMHYARKINWQMNLAGIFNRAMNMSDPVINQKKEYVANLNCGFVPKFLIYSPVACLMSPNRNQKRKHKRRGLKWTKQF